MRARDFIVSVPLPDRVNKGDLIYDVHVYPKNSQLGLAKSVADGNAGVAGDDAPIAGRVLTYTLRVDIPLPVDTSEGSVYELIDDLAAMTVPGLQPTKSTSDFPEFSPSDWRGDVVVSIDSESGTDQLTGCTEPTRGCDYVLAQSASKVTISMTGEGLEKLAAAVDADSYAQVVAELQARVKATINDATLEQVVVLPNVVHLIPNRDGKDRDLEIPSNEVRTIYSKLQLHKTDSRTGESLAGAVFTLYRTLDDAVAARDALTVSEPSGADGMVVFPGLHVTDFQNNEPDDDSYWIVETGVPSGYVGIDEPMQVYLSFHVRTGNADATGGFAVANTPEGEPTPGPTPEEPGEPTTPGKPGKPDGDLSWTGANVGWLFAAGLGLVLAGGLFAAVPRRRGEAGSEQGTLSEGGSAL